MAATNKRGVFSLEKVLERQSDNHWSKIPEVFRYVNLVIESAPAFGYLAGGRSTGDIYLTKVDRIDYGNDTATAAPKGNLDDGGNIAGTGNQSFGYTAGLKSQCNRIDYSSDTATAVQKGTLSSARTYISAVGNRNFGYWCGGTLPKTSFIDRLDYSNDTAATTPKGPLSIPTLASAGTGNRDFGYIGGLRPGESRTLRIDYSNDTAVTTEKGALIASGYMVAAAGNSDFGYWNSGSHGTRVGRLDYANDSVNAIFRGNTSYGGVKRAGTGSGSFGYFTGGYPAPETSIIDRVDYSNDTSISAKGNLSLAKYYHAGVSAQENGLATFPVPATRTETGTVSGSDFGYFGGGYTSSRVSTIDRIDYSNDTSTAAVKGPLSLARNTVASVSSVTHGYFAGGYDGYNRSTVDRVDYANDTPTAAVKGSLGYTNTGGCPVGDKNYGYVVGGRFNGSDSTHISRIDYSNDATTSSPKGNITQLNWYFQNGAGNQSYGYVAGGFPQGETYVERIDYSNDTAVALSRGPLAQPVRAGAAAGNANFGYFSGGSLWTTPDVRYTYVQRLDYSSDTSTASLKGNLTVARHSLGSAASTSHGYFAGGNIDQSSSSPISVVDRVDYANDTSTASPKGPLSVARISSGGTSSRENALPTTVPAPAIVDKGADGYTTTTLGPAFGYAIGGSWPIISTVDRIDYTNDTATAAVKGSLEITRDGHQSTSNLTHAYAAGGYPSRTSVSRIEFSNDTATAVAKGPLSSAHNYFGATGNTSFGYYAGGGPSVISTIDRIDYSNDTATASPKGPLSLAKSNSQACGNMSFGYWAGGGGSKSSVDRIDYSSDTSTASPKGNLESGRSTMAASGTSDFGYWSGGYPYYTKASRIDYANDTATAVAKAPYPSTVTPYGFSNAAGTGSSTHGYAAGGNSYKSYVWRIDYANDTANGVQKGPLSQGRLRLSGASAQENGMGTPTFIPRIRWVDSAIEAPAVSAVTEGPAFGYFAGGYTGSSRLSTMDRIDYSNDTPTATPKGPITVARNTGSATSNLSHGYFSGGYDGSDNLSRVDRVDYSNDTATATAKGNLEDGRTGAGGVGNINFGYVAGGRLESTNSESSQIDRIEYSNDTATALEKGNLLNNKYYYQGAVGNQDFGYFGGGRYPAPGGHSRVERIEYANDTATTVTKGPLSFVKNKIAATGTPAYGYFGGGSPTPYNTTVDRIDYANDTATASPKSTLTQGRGSLSAVSSPSHGYFGGGYAGSRVSTVDKIDFSNDTATATTVGTLSAGKSSPFATSSRNDALPSTVRAAKAAVAAPVQPPFPFPVQLPPPLITENLTLHLDAGDSNSYSGSGSMWYDLSGEAHNAQINGATYNSGDGGYFDFDGINDYIVNNQTDVIPTGTNSFTYSVWIYINTISSAFGSSKAASLFSGDSNGKVECGLFRPSGTGNGAPTQLKMSRHGGNNTGSCVVDISMNLSQWYNVTVVRDGVSSQVVYINGVSVGTGNLSNSFVSGTMTIGGAATSTGYHAWLNGRIGIVLMYNTALSSSQVLQNYKARKSRYGY